jgi:ABC-type nitrate/sulfonate/bicarbonate transport system substrate-binding protein
MVGFSRRDLLGAAALAAGTGAGLGLAVPAQAQQKHIIKIVNTQGNATVTLQELMKRQGYLQEMGVEPQITYVSDGSKLMGSLLSGENDICMFSGFAQVLTALEKGAKLKIVAGALVGIEHALYTKRDNIRTVQDLAGKTIGVGSVGALLHAMVIALLRKHKVDPASVRFVNIGSTADVFRAVVAGTVDAGVSEIDVYDQQAKYGVRVIKEGDLWKELPEFTFQASYASERAIANNREALVRTLAAYAKLYRFLMTPQSKDAYIEAQTAALGRADPAAAEWQWRFFRETGIYATDLVLSRERVNWMQELNLLLEVQRKALPYEQVFDASVGAEALKRLG